MLKEKTFDTGEIVLNYAESSPLGPPLVLLHGGARHWQDFRAFIPAISKKWQIYALDFRGHGKSSWMPGHYQLKDHVADILAFLEQHVSKPAYLFGHSMGGWVALMLAAMRPELVRAVIVGDSPLSRACCHAAIGYPDGGSYWIALQERVRKGLSREELIPALADRIFPMSTQESSIRYGDTVDINYLQSRVECLHTLDPEALTVWIHSCKGSEGFHALFEGYNDEDLFAAIACPVLLIQGNPRLGGVLADSDVTWALSILPMAFHVQIEEVDHYLGLLSGKVTPLLHAVSTFLDSL